MASHIHLDAPPADGRRMSPEEIFLLVRRELALVEQEFEIQISDAPGVVASIGRYLREGGGKRIRPALLLLASKLVCGEARPAAIRMAAVMEMLHTATLVHDDIIDDSRVRRGRASVNAKWGNDVTVLIGDWLYMTAFDRSLRERSFEILDLLTNMTRLMTEGEIIQLSLLGNTRTTRAEHIDIVRRKTGYMFGACAEVGGLVGGASREEQRALSRYGLAVGVAFQLIDDVLDFVSTEDKLGKPVANDLREGKLTLPVICLLEKGNEQHRRMIEMILRDRGFDAIARDDLLSLLHEYGALDRARAEAMRYAEEAVEAISIFQDSEFLQALLSVPQFLVDREM